MIYTLTHHARHVMHERGIETAWLKLALDSPDRVLEDPDDPTLTHHLKAIAERDDRVLRVVVDLQASPPRVVTAFFDRRLRKPG